MVKECYHCEQSDAYHRFFLSSVLHAEYLRI